jgi:glutamyl-tRNA reductase
MKDKIYAVELAFDKAPSDVCKQASERTQDSRELYRAFGENNGSYFILRTCCRIAVFTTASCPGKTIHFFESLGIEKKYVRTRKNQEAVELLLKIAAGLKSPNIGENEILHQLKNVLKEASLLKTIDVTLRKLLQKGIETGRRVRSETAILKNNLSYPAVIHKILKEKNVLINGEEFLIIGNGKLGNSCIKYFLNRGARITLATRKPESAFLWDNSIRVIPREQIAAVLSDYKVVLGAAELKKPLLSMEDITRSGKNAALFVDLGMPGNFDGKIGNHLPDSFFNLDDIFKQTRAIEQEKEMAIQQSGSIVEEETEAYIHWLKGRKAVKIINTLKEELEQIKTEEQNRLLNDLGEMDLHQKKIINSLVNRLASRIAHTHYSHIKEFVVDEQS